jgi:uncharacterized protein (DUF362 family)
MKASLVALSSTDSAYPQTAPFHPSRAYPEYPFPPGCVSPAPNGAYEAVRRAFELLGLDRANQGSAAWNPLGDIIKPGNVVVVKPNWVYHVLACDPRPHEVLITHPGVLRAVFDYVFLACGRGGTITLGDAPIQSADFQRIVEMSGIPSVIDLYRKQFDFEIRLVDFRRDRARPTASGLVRQFESDNADPNGYRIIDLAERSFLEGIVKDWRRFRSLEYDPEDLHSHHFPGTHQYFISGSVLDADVLVNVPKLKTHGKSGVTCSLKNLVGINGDKAYLPHFRVGSPSEGGDDHPHESRMKNAYTLVKERLILSNHEMLWRSARWMGQRAMKMAERLKPLPQVGGASGYQIHGGHWYGNDTSWRMVLDLNLLLFLGNKEGTIGDRIQRRYISVVDAICAGEGNGPLHPSRKDIGHVLAGVSPVAVDLVAARCMGLDDQKLPLLREARKNLGTSFPEPGSAPILVSSSAGILPLDEMTINWRFRAPDGWRGFVERDESLSRVSA